VSLPRFSVRRPVLTSMVTCMVVLIGMISLQRLQIDLLPSLELPTVSVSTDFPGASPEVMEQTITQVIEEIMATVPGVEEISSTSSTGDSRVRVRFGWGSDVDAAAASVRATLDDEINELPDDIVRPRVRSFDVGSFPVVLLGVASTMDPVDLTQIVEDQIRYRMGRVAGVAQVDLWGGFNREIRVELDPGRLAAQRLAFDEVVQALEAANMDLPAGSIQQDRFEVTLRAPAQFTNLEQIRRTVVGERGGAEIRLEQVGEVLDTYERSTEVERINGEPGIRVAIRKQPQANTVEVVRGVLEEVERINKAFPQLRVVAVMNQGNFIERSISNVARSVLLGGGLAVLVLLVFLRNLRSTAVVGLAIPISVVATLALMYFSGLTLNLMTLGGLALGVGMMVDSSIVVLENIFRRRSELGESAEVAAVEGADEVASAIVASTITTLVIFLPLVFVRGVTGLLFQDLAIVIVLALLASLLVSLSLVPVLASRLLLDEPPAPRPGLVQRASERSAAALVRLEEGYTRLLSRVLTRRWTTVGFAAALLAASTLLVPLIGSEFMPPSDEGEVRIAGEMEPGTRLDLVDRQTQRMEEIVFPAVPEVVASIVSVEDGQGEIRLNLTPASERSRSNTEIAAALRTLLEGKIPGMDVRVRAPQGQFLLERVLGAEEGLPIEIRGYELSVLDTLAEQVAERVAAVEGVTDVDLSRQVGLPQQELQVDRDKAADLGLRAQDLTRLLQSAMAGTDAGEYRVGAESYRIFVQLAGAHERSLDEVLDLTIRTPAGDLVPLRAAVDTEATRGPQQIDRKDQQRIVTVSANIAGRDAGSVAEDVQEVLDELPRPEGYDVRIAGSFAEQQRASQDFAVSLLLAILLVYMVLASQYESLRSPLVVMLSVPAASIGVFLTLFLTGTTFNVQSYIGCIMLGGIVVNNAILLVDQAGRLREEGYSTQEAVQEAGRRRLRPILMTTLTTILGLVPLALGIGEGADAQAPLARAVIGGLSGSTLITLVLIPAVYSLMHPGEGAEASG